MREWRTIEYPYTWARRVASRKAARKVAQVVDGPVARSGGCCRRGHGYAPIMPVVFVHGVATRKNPRTARRLVKRWQLIEDILGPVLVTGGVPLGRYEAFWGDEASKLHWHGASLPPAGGERFGGTASDEDDLVLAETLSGGPIDRTVNIGQPLIDAAAGGLSRAVDLLWTYTDIAAAPELADFIVRASAYAEKDPQPAWLDTCKTDEELLNELLNQVEPPDAEAEERFGGRALVRQLREAAARVGAAPGRLISRPAMLLRPVVHRPSAIFLGDVFEYLKQRGRAGADGAIATVVGDTIAEAMAARRRGDDKLVVIAHSMGGNIVYDLLSDLRAADLECDVLVTVGSQVGLFAELDMFAAVRPPDDPATGRVPALSNAGRWINVYDLQDGLSFAAQGVFAGVEDFAYSTGAGLLGSHSTYFERPSFFQRLVARIEAGPR